MQTLIIYLLKAAIFQTLLLGCYWLLLRRDTFYKMNRWYFLVGFPLSLLLPLINVDVSTWFRHEETASPAIVVYQYLPDLSFQKLEQSWWQQYGFSDYLLLAMLLGTVFMIVRLLRQYLSLRKLRSRDLTAFGSYNVQLLDEPVNPFSFGKTIYVNPTLHTDEELEEIVEHELVHILQNHSVDIITASVNRSLFWWNPAAWMLNKTVRDNLEYIADKTILEKGFDRKHYQYHLLRISQLAYSTSVAHHFNFSNLKKRIFMMNKQNTKPLYKMKWLLLLPLAVIVLLSFNFRNHFMAKEVGNKPNNLIFAAIREGVQDTVPPPPPPPVPPVPQHKTVPAVAPVPAVPAVHALPAGVKYLHIDKTVTVTLENGKKEKYHFDNPAEKAAYEKKYGVLPPPPPPPMPAHHNKPTVINLRAATAEPLLKEVSDADNMPPADVLVIIDGVPGNLETLHMIDPENIASMDILKGDKAIEAYGDKGKNGVIKVTTKAVIGYGRKTDKVVVGFRKSDAITLNADTVHIKNYKKQTPLYIVDGVEQSGQFVEKMKPGQIEAVTVLKDADAANVYGSKASHGVIIINTKNAKPAGLK